MTPSTSRAVRRLVATVLLLCGPHLLAQLSQESELKAQALYSFLLFIEWPAESFPTPSTPIRICVDADSGFVSTLNRFVQGRDVNGRPITVSVADPGHLDGCHVLFVSDAAEAGQVKRLLPGGAAPVLVVGDTEASVRNGAIIGFFKDRNKLRFEINADAAARTGLKISSKLMNLARIVGSGASD
jgi:hypothetical protein